MNRTPQLVVGALLAIVGLVFFLQGIDVLKGSGMSDSTTWSVIGPIVAVVGVVLVVRGLRSED